jgi:hypothetical protein
VRAAAPATSLRETPRAELNRLADPGRDLRADNFQAFMEDRQTRLLSLIEQATGKSAYTGSVAEEGEMSRVTMTP